jgi:hypothetical protein
MPSGGLRPGAGRKRKDLNDYEHKQFTSIEIECLLTNPYVSFVSRTTISYTVGFKEMFWQRYCDGIPPAKIFADAGFDTEIISKSRIDGFLKSLKDQFERGLPFNDGRTPHTEIPDKKFDLPKARRFPKNTHMPYTPEAIAKMAHELAYLKQEMEFLKKIILAGTVEK